MVTKTGESGKKKQIVEVEPGMPMFGKSETKTEVSKTLNTQHNSELDKVQSTFDLKNVVEIEIEFDDDDIVPYQRNSGITENLIGSDGNVDVLNCFNIFTTDGSKPLLTGANLAQKLKGKGDPFAKRGGTENPGNLLFSSRVWDVVLETQFLKDKKPTDLIKEICATFIPAMKDHTETDFSLVEEYVKWINDADADNGEKNNICNSTCNWFDVPAVLRMLAPTYKSLVETEYNAMRYFCQTTMKGLPHSVIMMPWYVFKLHNCVPGLKDKKEVRKI